MDLRGKAVFVTGGSGDIGRAIARAFAGAGSDVAISYVGEVDRAKATLDDIETLGRRGLIVRLDQRDPASIEASVDQVIAGLNRMDILVNNAAWSIGIPYQDLEQLNAEIWDQVMETNLRGPYLLARAFAPHLSASGAGRIINIASTAGMSPSGSSIAYASSKAGLLHLTRCLAVALAPTVTVNCVAPGLVEETRMAQRLPTPSANRARSQAVLGRVGNAEDIAAQALAFCRADAITGQTVAVDGGMPVAMR